MQISFDFMPLISNFLSIFFISPIVLSGMTESCDLNVCMYASRNPPISDSLIMFSFYTKLREYCQDYYCDGLEECLEQIPKHPYPLVENGRLTHIQGIKLKNTTGHHHICPGTKFFYHLETLLITVYPPHIDLRKWTSCLLCQCFDYWDSTWSVNFGPWGTPIVLKAPERSLNSVIKASKIKIIPWEYLTYGAVAVGLILFLALAVAVVYQRHRARESVKKKLLRGTPI